ncbi:MAG: winged helix-turn-helix domain-containing protein, partial [Sphingomicrobium sp.]
MLDSVTYRIGHWTFVPAAHELRSGQQRVRVEQRASATLALLCQRRGQVVSHDELIEHAWAGRQVSPNSVAVVIGGLRRALDLAPGTAGAIETVPKAGYRLIEEAAAKPVSRAR